MRFFGASRMASSRATRTPRAPHWCAPITDEFYKRLVTKKGAKKRMGILDFWQHGAGIEARLCACSDKNPCGLKRDSRQRANGIQKRCLAAGRHGSRARTDAFVTFRVNLQGSMCLVGFSSSRNARTCT